MDKWGETTKGLLFSRDILHPEMLNAYTAKGSKDFSRVQLILKIASEVAVSGQAILSHPFAMKVLKSFNAERLFDSDYISQQLASLIDTDKHAGSVSATPELWVMINQWDHMISCVGPLQDLTIPSEVIEEKEFDEILTIQIIRSEEISASLDTLQAVIQDTNKLYEIFSTFGAKPAIEPLRVVYIASGSSIRIDMRGLGEPIKQIKNLLVEGWNLWRHRKSTDLNENSRALLSSLKAFGEIEKLVKNGTMKRLDADALKARLQKSALGLFNEGALPREIPTVESIPNHALLELKPQRLLSAPEVILHEEAEIPEPPMTVEDMAPHELVIKTKTKRKRAGTRKK